MEFSQFNAKLQNHIAALCQGALQLYTVDLDTDALWELYLASFPPGTNEIYRERAEHDCSCCRHFVKSFGNVVAIVDGAIVSIWDAQIGDTTYQPVVDALAAFVKSHAIGNVFVTKQAKFGVAKTYDTSPGSTVTSWYHFFTEIPATFVTKSPLSEASIMGGFRDNRNVFKRSLDEITSDAVATVLELIASNSLYKGEEWQGALQQFQSLQTEYQTLGAEGQELYAWSKMVSVGGAVGKIRNHSIGVLLQDISGGMDLDQAVRRYEQIVAPTNYKRPKEIFTKQMLASAQKTLEELGLMAALGRRHATIDDITVNNILFANRDSAAKMSGASVFAEMAATLTINPKSFDRVDEIPIERFVADVLPTATAIEILLENRHSKQFVSLIAPQDPNAPTLFKWANGFSWAYTGNITDSELRQAVQARGGRVDGVFRFSHSWNYDKRNASLMDLHVFMPWHHMTRSETSHIRGMRTDHPDGVHDNYGNSARVGWNARNHRLSGGVQDVDYTQAAPVGYIPVENTTFPDLHKMPDGVYVCKIHNWALRQPTKGGFRAEIECGGELYQYEVTRPLANKEWITVAEVTLCNGVFTVEHKLPTTTATKTVWGLTTNQFQPVSVMMYSPNYWDAQDGIGHRHVFFMLDGCQNPDAPNGFFNEYLRQDLDVHKRVFAALGSRMAVTPTPSQLSGLGFSTTKRDNIIVKVTGHTQRTLKVRF